MTTSGPSNVIKKMNLNFNAMSLDELYKFQAKINTVQSQMQYPSGIIDLSFLQSKETKPADLEQMVDSTIMAGGNAVYWPIRMIILNALTQGSLNMADFEEPNLKKIMASDEFKKSLIQAIVDKKIVIATTTTSTGNSVSLLLDIQEIIKTPIPSGNTGAIYKSLMQKYEKVMEVNQDLLDPTKKKRILDSVFRNFGGILRQMDQAVQRQIATKSRGGGGCGCGGEIIRKMNRLNMRELEKIKKQMGGDKLKKILKSNKYGSGNKDARELQKKLDL